MALGVDLVELHEPDLGPLPPLLLLLVGNTRQLLTAQFSGASPSTATLTLDEQRWLFKLDTPKHGVVRRLTEYHSHNDAALKG